MKQMHVTNTSSPSRTAAPTAPATTAPMGTPVLSGVEVVLNMVSVVLLVSAVASRLVVEDLVVTLGQRVSSVIPVLK